jgi:hypothetical protein
MRKMKIGIFRKTRVGAIFAVLSVMLCAICASYFLFPVHPEITPPPIACTSKKHDVVLAGQRLSIPVAEIIRFQKTNELGQKYLSQIKDAKDFCDETENNALEIFSMHLSVWEENYISARDSGTYHKGTISGKGFCDSSLNFLWKQRACNEKYRPEKAYPVSIHVYDSEYYKKHNLNAMGFVNYEQFQKFNQNYGLTLGAPLKPYLRYESKSGFMLVLPVDARASLYPKLVHCSQAEGKTEPPGLLCGTYFDPANNVSIGYIFYSDEASLLSDTQSTMLETQKIFDELDSTKK